MATWSNADRQETWAHVEARLLSLSNAQSTKLLVSYCKQRMAEHVRTSTLDAQSYILHRMAHQAGKKQLAAIKEEWVRDYFHQLGLTTMPSTVYHHWVVVHGFFKWLSGKANPPQVGKFKVARPKAKELKPSDLITADEFAQILKVCRNEMEVAFLVIMFDAGIRRTEMTHLRVDDVLLSGDEIQLVVNVSKTKERDVLLFASIPYLKEWLARHKYLNKKGAPLFYHKGNKRTGGVDKSVDNNWVTNVMNRINDHANIGDKHIYPHLFRHTAATNMARRGVREATLRKHFGWTKDSDMPTIYVHLSQEDHNDELRRAHGRVTAKPPEPVGLEPRKCPHCQHANPRTEAFCLKCSRPVSPEAQELMRRNQEAEAKRLFAGEAAKAMKADIAAEVRRMMAADRRPEQL
jgi:integrase